MKTSPASQSPFFNQRVSLSLAFCSIGVLLALFAFAMYPGATARAQRPQQPQMGAQEKIIVLNGRFMQEPAPRAQAISIVPKAESGEIDVAIRPLPAPLAPRHPPSPSGVAVGIGSASLSISPEIVDQNITRAFCAVGANFTPGETVSLSLNGGAPSFFVANADGRILVALNTGAGFGFITVHTVGMTSGREAGGVVQVAPTGPYLPGVAIAPHAINPTGTSTINLVGTGYPPNASVTLRRNGMSLGTTTTGATGGFSVSLTLAVTADGSAVYSVDNDTAGSFVGQTIEERADAGAPPLGDQNVTRAFLDRAVVDSAIGGIVALVGEGFQAGESVTLSGCTSATLTADANNAVSGFVGFPSGAGSSTCTLTGGTSGRLARASVVADPSVTNMRGLIIAPAFVAPAPTLARGAGAPVLSDPNGAPMVTRIYLYTNLRNAFGTVALYVDGIRIGTFFTDKSGLSRGPFSIAATGSVRAVECVANDGAGDAQAAVLLVQPTPTPTPTQVVNVSTRMRVQTGDNVGIGGLIITGSVPKEVIVRAIGPSLSQFDIPNVLADPVLELHGPNGFTTITNDNWRDTQEAEIQATGIPPTNDLESAIVATLDPGAYTAIVRGNGNTTGVALVEVYDLNQEVDSKLANLSTRAFVSTGDNIVIAGFLLSDNSVSDRVIVRGIGPSLAPGIFPASEVLANPTLELRDSNGTLLIANNDWQDNAAQAAEITAAGLAPSNDLESAIAATLPPGLYTGLLAGLSDGTGIGVVEIYDRGP